jgi:hypothetical protein
MALGLRGRLRSVESLISPDNRFREIALQFEIHDMSGPTGRRFGSEKNKFGIYGGVWDTWLGGYTRDEPSEVLILPCSERQAAFIQDRSKRVGGKGGRGGGKSEGLVEKIISKLIDSPGLPGQVVAPISDQYWTVWHKLLSKIPLSWLLPGLDGIKKSDRELRFMMGSTVRFRSAIKPDSLRSYDCAWIALDEEKDQTDEAIDIAWGSLRVGPERDQQLFGVGTPEQGEFQERWERLETQANDPDCEITIGLHSFPSDENPFIDPKTWAAMRSQMDSRRYRQEVLAEFVPRDDIPLVFPEFDPDIHGITWPIPDAVDVTADVVKKRLNLSMPYIIGVDPNYDWPNYAVVCKVFRIPVNTGGTAGRVTRDGPVKRAVGGTREVMVAWDIVQAKGHSGKLASELKERGYGNSCIIIDAASGKGPRGKMRAEGMRVFHPKRNPWQTDSVTDVLTKLAPTEGEPSLFVRMPECEELSDGLQACFWMKNGKKIDKSMGIDHVVDALRYVVSYFYPAARITSGPTGYSLR